jgi:hypothetical protein
MTDPTVNQGLRGRQEVLVGGEQDRHVHLPPRPILIMSTATRLRYRSRSLWTVGTPLGTRGCGVRHGSLLLHSQSAVCRSLARAAPDCRPRFGRPRYTRTSLSSLGRFWREISSPPTFSSVGRRGRGQAQRRAGGTGDGPSVDVLVVDEDHDPIHTAP